MFPACNSVGTQVLALNLVTIIARPTHAKKLSGCQATMLNELNFVKQYDIIFQWVLFSRQDIRNESWCKHATFHPNLCLMAVERKIEIGIPLTS